uniref:E2F/DP family winged-helix DNA-binding domain-containing protein n=1 Tax=Gouania willdenowi TaxID=441366 RepID=A0A8C5G9U0_GOUWI
MISFNFFITNYKTFQATPHGLPTPRLKNTKSLCYLGMKFMTLLKQSTDGELDLNQVSQMLEAPKRRIYDITNVLQGINLVFSGALVTNELYLKSDLI